MYNLRCVYMCCWNIFNHKIFFLLWMSQLLHRSWATGREKLCWNICVFWHKVSVYCNFFTFSLMFVSLCVMMFCSELATGQNVLVKQQMCSSWVTDATIARVTAANTLILIFTSHKNYTYFLYRHLFP